MRSFVALGVVSLVAFAGMAACGDDDSTTRPGGIGGSAGAAGGRGGAGGTAGTAAGTGGAAGFSGGATGGAGGTAPLPAVTCTGCVAVQLPFTAAGQRATYQINHTPQVDLSNATVTWLVQVLTPNAGLYIKPQLQNGAPNYPGYFAAPAVPLTAAAFPAGQWTEVSLDVGALPAAPVSDAGAEAVEGDAASDAAAPVVGPTVFDKSVVDAIQLQIGSTVAGTGTALVLLDGLTITGAPGVAGATFNAGAEGFALNTFAEPTLIPTGTPPVAVH